MRASAVNPLLLGARHRALHPAPLASRSVRDATSKQRVDARSRL